MKVRSVNFSDLVQKVPEMGLLVVDPTHGRVVGVLRTIVDDLECLRVQELRELCGE